MVAPPTLDHMLNDALAGFNSSLEMYMPLLEIWGVRILGAVTFLGFGYAVIQAVSNRDWFGTLMAFGWGIVRIALVYVVMANFEAWGSAWPDLGAIVGQSVSGLSPSVTTPSGLYDLGLQIVYIMDDARTLGAWFKHPLDTVLFLGLTFLTHITWAAAALVYLWLLIETKYYVAVGPIVICLSSFEYTWPILEHWAISLVQVGTRLLAALLVLAVGLGLAHTWTSLLAAEGLSINTDQVGFGTAQLVAALLFFYALWALPKKAASLIQGKGSSGVADHSAGGDEAMWALLTNRVRRAVL